VPKPKINPSSSEPELTGRKQMFVGEFLPSGGGGSPAFSPTLNLYQCFAAQVRPLSLQPAIGSPGISARISVFINVLPPGFRLSRQAAACNRLLEPALIRRHPDQSEPCTGGHPWPPHLQAPKSTFSFRGATMTSAAMSIFINVLVQSLPYSRFWEETNYQPSPAGPSGSRISTPDPGLPPTLRSWPLEPIRQHSVFINVLAARVPVVIKGCDDE